MRTQLEQTLETVRRWYGFWITGYVVMPEHVHLLVSEPERNNLALALQMLKQIVSRNRPSGWPIHSRTLHISMVLSSPNARPEIVE